MIANRAQMADILGCSLVTLDQRRSEGMPGVKEGREWRFDTAVVIAWLIDRDKEGNDDDVLKRVNLRERSAIATLRELELGEKQKVLIHVDDVADLVENEYAIVKSRLQAIPGRMAQALAVESDATKVMSALKQEVSEALEEISKHDADQDDVDAI